MDNHSRKSGKSFSVEAGSLSQPSRRVISTQQTNGTAPSLARACTVLHAGSEDDSDVAAHSVRKFTWKELSQLNQRHNAHVAYRGKVYDVSSFVSKHPGGLDQIMMGAGHDITHVFEFYHRHETFDQVLSKYYVGELVDNELPIFPTEESEFYRTLKKRVAKHMKENINDPKINYWAFIRHTLLIAFVFVTWYLALVTPSLPISLFFTCIWSSLSVTVIMTCFHDASHFTLTHNPWVWKAVMFLSEGISGHSSYCWSYQHVFGHHPYTNIDNSDPDCYTGSGPAIRRIKKFQIWLHPHLYQHLYLPLIYTLAGAMYRLQDFLQIMKLKNVYIRMNPLSPSQWAMFWFGKIFHAAMRIIIPYFFLSLGNLVLLNIVYEAFNGLWLSLITSVNHVFDEDSYPEPDENNVIHTDWAELQVRTTLDYCTDSWLWYILSGGLNHQTAHHLFPGIMTAHCHRITPIVEQTCAEFGIKYNKANSFWDALLLHFTYLKKMGSGHPHLDHRLH